MITKLKSALNSAGETLIETIVAISIFTIAMGIVFTLTSTAHKLMAKAIEEDRTFTQNMNAAESHSIGAGDGAEITFSFTFGTQSKQSTYDTNIYDAGSNILYFKD